MLGILGLLLFALISAVYPEIQKSTSSFKNKWAPTPVIFALAILQAATVFFQEHLIAVAAQVQRPFPHWLHGLPATPVLDTAPFYGHIDSTISSTALLIALVQTASLLCLIVIVRNKNIHANAWLAIWASAAAMAAICLRSRGLLSDDVYAYIAYGIRGAEAYVRQKNALPTGLSSLYHLWGNPIVLCPYGPTWLLPATVLMHGVTNIEQGLLRFRLAGIVNIALLLYGIRRLRLERSVLLATAINPFLWEQYVADAHNDLWPVTMVIIATAYARSPLIAILLAATAGAMKAPFVLIGCVAASVHGSLQRRIITAVTSIATAVALSAVLGGRPYLDAIQAATHMYSDHSLDLLRLMAVGTAALALAWAVLGRRYAWGTGFSFQAIGFIIFPWYAIWGFSLVALSADADIFLTTLPVVAYLTSTQYIATNLWVPLLVTIFITSATLAWFCLRETWIRLRLQTSTIATR